MPLSSCLSSPRRESFVLLRGALLCGTLLASATFGTSHQFSAHAQQSGQPKITTSAPASGPAPIALIAGGLLFGALVGGSVAWALKRPEAPSTSEVSDEVLWTLSPFPLARINQTERVVRANDGFLHALGATNLNAVEGQALSQFFHPDDLTRVRVGLRNIFDGDSNSYRGAVRLFQPDGSLVHAFVSARRGDDENKPRSLLVSLEDVTRAVEAEDELEGSRAAMSALYHLITGDRSRGFEEKMRSVLEMGTKRFNLPVGALSRVHDDGEGHELLETLFVTSPDRRVRPALVIGRDAEETVEGRLMALHLLPPLTRGREAVSTPVVHAHAPEAVLAAPIIIEDGVFGVLSFASTQARTLPFEREEIELIGLMADWVGGEIEREQARLDLYHQQEELMSANEKLEALATHDPLTEAKNRRAFNAKLEEEWSRAQRYGTPLSLVLLDVDKFKSYNDSFGHPAGDEVLKKVALTIMGGVRGTDFFARYGGEEFALILPNTDQEGAFILADRLRERIEQAKFPNRAVTASFGVATLSALMTRPEELIASTDEALYVAKERGRNRVVHANDANPNSDDANTTSVGAPDIMNQFHV